MFKINIVLYIYLFQVTQNDKYVGYFQSDGPANGLNVFENTITKRRYFLSANNQKIYC